jgi:hypothetical protein
MDQIEKPETETALNVPRFGALGALIERFWFKDPIPLRLDGPGTLEPLHRLPAIKRRNHLILCQAIKTKDHQA